MRDIDIGENSGKQSWTLFLHYLFTSCRRIGSCETVEGMKKPGWAKTNEGKWVTVINTHEYPQEVRTVSCKKLGSKCELSYSKAKTSCQQKYAERRYEHDGLNCLITGNYLIN